MKKITRDKYEIILLILLVLLLVRSLFGFHYMDESFYMSLAHRLWHGDKLVVDEWHPTQFYSFILLPFYSVFRLFSSDSTGVILYFRILNCIFAFFTSLFMYRRIKEENPGAGIFALCGAMPLLLYAKSNNLGPSYNNLCACFSALALGLLSYDKNGAKRLFIAGIFMALAVTCMPYLGAAVIIYSAVCVLKRRRIWSFIAGMAATAAVYVLVCFPLWRIGEMVINFEYIFKDPEHGKGFLKYLENNWRSFGIFNYSSCLFYALLIFWAVTVALMALHLYPGEIPKSMVFAACTVMAALHAYAKLHRQPGFAGIAYAEWMAFATIVNLFEKRLDRLSIYMICGGLIIAAVYAGGSDTGFNSMTTGFTVCMAGMAISAYRFCEALIKNKAKFSKALKALAAASLCFIMATMLMQRIFIVFRDSDLENMTVRMDRGVAAGLYTTPQHKEQYDKVVSFLDELKSEGRSGTYFFSKTIPWAYVYTDFDCGAPTAWRTELSSPLLESYYLLHPDKIPDTVVVMHDDIGTFDTNTFSRTQGRETPNKNELEGWLYTYMNENGYEATEYEVATVYRR